jgi:hypothetical protein
MRRLVYLPMLLFALAACGDSGPPPGAPPGAPMSSAQVRVGFGGLVDTIEIAAIERRPLRAAELVASDGSTTPSGPITVDSSPRSAIGQWAAGNPWKDPVTGDNAMGAMNLRHPQGGAALRAQDQILAMLSNAQIPLADPIAYRRDWANYRIRLSFGTPPSVETQELPAPAPPPR